MQGESPLSANHWRNIRFLERQGIALRGSGDEIDSNFSQLLRLRIDDIPDMQKWLDKKKDKYTSPDIQNELVKVMALSVL